MPVLSSRFNDIVPKEKLLEELKSLEEMITGTDVELRLTHGDANPTNIVRQEGTWKFSMLEIRC